MEFCAVLFFDLISVPLWFWIILAGVLVLGIVIVIWVQCRKAINRKRTVHTVDWSGDAKLCIEEARKQIESGLLEMLRSEFGTTIPEDHKSMMKFISDTFAERSGGLYIPVEAFAPFLRGNTHLFLHGSDVMGGVSVVPVRISERGEKYFFLEGLALCYRRDEYQSVSRYNIRFLPGKAGQPIEEVLDFEVYKPTVSS